MKPHDQDLLPVRTIRALFVLRFSATVSSCRFVFQLFCRRLPKRESGHLEIMPNVIGELSLFPRGNRYLPRVDSVRLQLYREVIGYA